MRPEFDIRPDRGVVRRGWLAVPAPNVPGRVRLRERRQAGVLDLVRNAELMRDVTRLVL